MTKAPTVPSVLTGILWFCSAVAVVTASLSPSIVSIGLASILCLYAIFSLYSDFRRRRSAVVSPAAMAQWSAERVVEATAGAKDRVAATKLLRQADRRLSLADAVHLVDESTDFAP